MSTERQEPRISIALDEEDIAQRAPAGKGGNGGADLPPPPPPASGGSGFILFMLALLIVALAAAAYYLFDRLLLTQGELKQAQSRLDALEQRLSSADESLEQNSVTTAVKLKELDSEVRKLWDNVWKRQKAELAEHDAQIAKNEKRLASIESRNTTLSAELKKALDGYKADRESLKSMSGKLDRVIAQSEVNKKTLLDVNKQLAAGGSLDARVKDLEKRMEQSEQWLDSVNAFRRQVNREIDALRQTITQYHAGSPEAR
ncbi:MULTISPECIES: hypothetical protein [Spongiibacter]|uniref:hypothetical protein n=2 Tax=Spongiibacteraceae TaxID=1706375 RepID=UPI000C58D2BA|nr:MULTISPECIES: hypothetical protein [Spongiibacter]MAY38391.1 hypothetical protein [Spongiibacter sp.]MBI59077.1 hypothetical protein [Spongiibacter sp.]